MSLTSELLREYPVISHATRGIRGRSRADIIAAGALALAEGQRSGVPDAELLRFVQHACRKADRRERAWDHRVSFDVREVRKLAIPDHANLWEAISALPKRQFCVIVLRFWEGMSTLEVAAETGCTEESVKSLSKRALMFLQNYLRTGDSFSASQRVHIVEGETKGMRSMPNGTPLEKSA